MMTRLRFTADFKAGVALEVLRGDKTIQEIAIRHKVHPNQVSAWKRCAMDGLGELFSNGAERLRSNRETEVKERRHHLYSRSAGLSASGRGQPEPSGGN